MLLYMCCIRWQQHWLLCVIGSRMKTKVKSSNFKRNKSHHHHETPHTSGRRVLGPTRGQMVQTEAPLLSQGHRPHPFLPLVPPALTRRAHINRKLASSASHFSSAAHRASISHPKAQHQEANNMSPSITSEANQPLPARSTVAQRKQANELRKVRKA